MALKNVTIVYHMETGQPRMLVIDANDLTDPAWKPEGHEHINIHPDVYNKMTHDDLHTHIHNVITSVMSTVDPAPIG